MLRIWGRVYAPDGSYTWVAETTDKNGDDSYVYLVNLVQVLRLVLGESPFFANYGIPAVVSVLQQVFPDFYVSRTQSQFAAFFSSLIVAKLPSTTPTYNINAVTKQGVLMQPLPGLPVGLGGAS